MLVNISNHPSRDWTEKQKGNALAVYGSVVDIAFPPIDPAAEKEEVQKLANEFFKKIESLANVDAVHLMGEQTFCYYLLKRLEHAGINCIASTTRRVATENEDGSKNVSFNFEMFRSYF